MDWQWLGSPEEIVGSLGIMILAVYRAFPLIAQARSIWREKSGQSISFSWMLYFFFLCPVYAIYGLDPIRIPLLFHGVLSGLCYIPSVIGLWKFKRLSVQEKWLVPALFLLILTMLFVQKRGFLFLVLAFGGVIATSLQAIELYRSKSVGVLNTHLLFAIFIVNIFWLTYAIAINDIPLKILCIAYFPPILANIYFWFIYRKKP